jgi:protoheme IX farnesyltransferase
MYVFVYAAAKRGSYHGTLVGAIPGALPPVAGYVAVSGSLDLGALLLFCILVFWQMPHFYAIAIYRRAEYKAAGIPVISVAKGVPSAKRAILLYIVAFMIASLCLALAGYVGWIYVVIMALMSVIWLVVGVKGLHAPDSDSWARMMFRYSLIVTLVFSILISVDNLFTALYS